MAPMGWLWRVWQRKGRPLCLESECAIQLATGGTHGSLALADAQEG